MILSGNKKMKPKISVIIPVFNGAKYLPRCLDSLLNQTFQDWIAICIDDGSTDNTAAVLDEYADHDKRFVVVHKKNAGVSAARNDGIKLAKSEYVHFMDADDILDDNYYEEIIKTAGQIDADIYGTGFVSNSKYSANLIYKKQHVMKTLFAKLFWSQAFVKSFVWRYVFRTEFIKKNKLCFDTNLISQEDAIFVLDSFVVADKIVIVPNVSYHYIFNVNSALNKKDRAHHDKLKRQYKIGKQYKVQYAKKNKVASLWRFRKLIKLFF